MRKANGQTLIELIAAVAVIGIGLFAATNVVFSNLNLVDRDSDSVVSVNLAREALELAKNKRDSNWLEGVAFDTGMYSGTDYSATPIWNGKAATYSFDFGPNDFSDSKTKVLKLTDSPVADFLANYSTGYIGTTSTFSRLVTFNGICANGTIVGAGVTCAVVGSTKIGIRVMAQIRNVRKGRTKDITMYEDLYDWR
ncbi:MAG: type II secretion system protein [Patescibacteria group bacterium]|nr:type II secretion system protein [Patescibacteria group bacterium]